MQPGKFILSLIILLTLILLLDNSWNIKGIPVPPLGRFLDPYHGFWQNIETKNERTANEISIKGLRAPVTVHFDSLLIPHIFAQNDADLYKAQGYITAMYRLWQMEFQTHAAAGRVSEIISGDPILDYDRRQRRLGMVFGAQRALSFFEEDPTMKIVIENYTEGINEYIRSLSYEDLPFEYKLLDYQPEAWTPIKCALLLKNMAQTLNMGDKDIEMTNALKLFGKQYVDLLYPDDEGVGDPIVENPQGWNFKPVSIDSVEPVIPQDYITIQKQAKSDPTTGSNNWAVSGQKTATKAPILCNDPHLNLSLPSLWYVLQLHAPGVNVMGASLPGAPGIIIGFNDSVAWGVTNAQRDLVDWYKITYRDRTKNEYLLDSQWVKTEKVVEAIRVKGGNTVYDTVAYTHWGPVTYDHTFHADNNLSDYAFRWVAHDRSEEVMTFYKLNRSKNYSDYMDALDHFQSPAQNFAFASVSGDIAMRVQGKFPVRRPVEGKFVLEGNRRSNGWLAFIPNEQNIAEKNPERGFVSSANQYPADKNYPYYITATSYEAYRNRRINQVLRSSDSITVEDMMKLQNDNFNLKAAESLPLFLSMLDSTSLDEAEAHAFKILKSWDFYNNKQSEGASYYEAWWDALMPLIWDEMESEDFDLQRPTSFQTIKLIKDQPDLVFFDIKKTEAKEQARDVVRQAFKVGVNDIGKWKASHQETVSWGVFKDSYIGHLLPPLRAFSIPVVTGGNHDIVNAHSRTHGPSWRMIVSLGKAGPQAWGVYPGGQSGNAGSQYYDNLLSRWVEGKYFNLVLMNNEAKPSTNLMFSTTLRPD
jgi:penicillin G amidase